MPRTEWQRAALARRIPSWRHRLEHRVYLALRRRLWRLAHQEVRGFGRRLGAIAYRLDWIHRRVALGNLALAFPELPVAARRLLARRCYEQLVAGACEVVSLGRESVDQVLARVEVVGWEHVEQARQQGRGVLLISAHLGPAEIAASVVARRLGGATVVLRPPHNPLIAEELEQLRNRFGCRLLPKRFAGHQLLNVLRRGGTAGVLVDQRVRGSQGILVPFFGHPVRISQVPAYLSLLTGAWAVPLFCVPAEEDGRYRLYCREPIVPAEGAEPGPESERELTARYLAAIEREVRRQPEQWLWMHTLWREVQEGRLAPPMAG